MHLELTMGCIELIYYKPLDAGFEYQAKDVDPKPVFYF